MAFLPWVLGILLVALVFVLWAVNYRKVGPNQVLVISGRTSTVTEPDGRKRRVGYRLQVGGGTFVMPLLESVQVLPLDVISVSIRCPEVLTAHGVMIGAEAFGQVKVSSDERLLHRAVENFLSRGTAGIAAVAQEVLEGHMRAALGTMAVEEIYSQRDRFAERVRGAAQADFQRLGLELLAFSLKDITDSQGYLEALGARRIAEVKRDAAIAQAETERDAAIRAAQYRKEGDVARLAAEAELAAANRDFEIQRAEFQAAVNAKRAQAEMAYELERVRLAEQLKRQEYQVRLVEKELAARVEEQEIALREKHLEATVKRPAEAEAYRARLEAEAEAYRKELEAKGRAAGMRLEGQVRAEAMREVGKAEAEAMREKAAAWRDYTQAALAEMVIQKLPELARAVAEPLGKVERIVMVGDAAGASKLTGQVGAILAQLPAVVESLTGVKLEELLAQKLGAKEEKES
ncbi:MAG: SPFH domain-containing protein [Thermoanaerobaculum sp.]|nr:SPFH domain-containing protein [Thermoanaerobaculum sp.]MCX7894514.1 SPFH domain-containing protein [Thermoanaerobaculum sp.]MDW7968154.1 SPFH domain-containing protein [Thermoanaerobaculum sp.]